MGATVDGDARGAATDQRRWDDSLHAEKEARKHLENKAEAELGKEHRKAQRE